jgi:hypothetical protein
MGAANGWFIVMPYHAFEDYSKYVLQNHLANKASKEGKLYD